MKRHRMPLLAATGALALAVTMGLAWGVTHRWHVPGPGSRVFIPVLELHRVLPGESGEYAMTPENLEKLLVSLEQHHYTPLSLDQFENALLHRGPLPPQPVLVTFDDAMFDNYEYALPILLKHHYKATFFVPTGKISTSPEHRVLWDDGTNWFGMTWDEVRATKAAGMDIGSHSVNHVNLRKADQAVMTNELWASRLKLEKQVGGRVHAVSYPGGRQCHRVRDAASAAGYTLGFLSAGGPIELYPTNPLALPRVPIPGYLHPEAIISRLPRCEWK